MYDHDKYLHIAETMAQLESGAEITADRQRELDEWLAESEEHGELYARMVRRGSFEDYRKTVAHIDFGEMVGMVWHGVRRHGRHRKARRIAAVPAAVVLIAAAVFALRVSVGDRNAGTARVIGPGTTQALMILPDGHCVELGAQQPEDAMRDYFGADSAGTAEGEPEWERPRKIRIEIPRGGEYRFTLADGTRVWLNSETAIEYPGRFTGDSREVYLSGEAFFDVVRDSLHPFEVSTPDGLAVTVLGTRFNLSNYDDTGDVRVTLAEGSVALRLDGGGRLTLRPDQQAVFDRGTRSLTVHDVHDAEVFSAWTDGKFVFEFAEIEDVMKQLARWYDVEVEYEHRPSQRFGGSISRDIDLAQALELLRITEAVDFEIRDNRVIVKETPAGAFGLSDRA